MQCSMHAEIESQVPGILPGFHIYILGISKRLSDNKIGIVDKTKQDGKANVQKRKNPKQDSEDRTQFGDDLHDDTGLRCLSILYVSI